jgi:hypothetical protein
MIGEKFGKWTVANQIETDKRGKYYECICECGNIRPIKGTDLRAKRTRQCAECQYAKLYDPAREIGEKYGKWTVIRFIDVHRKLQRFECECECGTRGNHCVADLRAGKSKQCTNCHNRENAQNNTKHGYHKELIYKVWCSMLARCNNPNTPSYYRYGGRGIKVCERWHKFENFLEDMGDRPEGMTIDRINNDGNYEKDNCRWVSHKENCNNRAKKYTHRA